MSIQGTELTEFGEFEGGEFEGGEFEGGEFEGGEFEGGEFEGGEYEGGEYEGGEYEGGEYEGGEYEGEQFLGDILGSVLGGEFETPFSEAQESELVAELLELGSEQELEQFLGNLFRRVSRSVGGFIRSPVGRALGGVLKNVAKKALPVVGGALGSMVAPGIGTAVGSKLGSMASRLFEVELEAMPAEAAEYEVARRFVNLAASAARHAALARPRPGVNPQATARAAVAAAARHHAPGVYRIMLQSLGGPAAERRPMGVVGGVRRQPMPGRPVSRAMPGRPVSRAMPGRPVSRAMPGRPVSRAAPSRRTAVGGPARRPYPTRGPGYVSGYQGAPSGYGQRRRPGGAYPAYGRRRRYGWGYGGGDAPWYWTEPWTDGSYYGDVSGGDVPIAAAPSTGVPVGVPSSDGIQASGRWVRRGRQIILFGI